MSTVENWRLTPTSSKNHFKLVPDSSRKIASESADRRTLLSDKPQSLQPSKSADSVAPLLTKAETLFLRPLKATSSFDKDLFNFEKNAWLTNADLNNWKGDLPLNNYQVNTDSSPIVRTKRVKDDVEYIQEMALRYLKPPTPPQPGEIVITQKPNILTKPAPPLVIRQQPPRPVSPPPLVIREEPPIPPRPVGVKYITVSGKKIPPAPRKVVIERLPQIPSRPQDVIVERWLPYPAVKRRVIFRKTNQRDTLVPKPKNVIIQWENPNVRVQTAYKHIGVVSANPTDYVNKFGRTLVPSSKLPEFVHQIPAPDGIKFAHNSPQEYELVGDVEALELVDLDKEGLSEYKYFLEKSKSISNLAEMDEAIEGNERQVFVRIDVDGDGKVTREEAEKMFLKINSQLGRSYGEKDVDRFMSHLDLNNDGAIDFEEFKNAYHKLLN